MKRVVLIILLAFSVKSYSESGQKMSNPCPLGTHPVYVNDCDGFRFHRPALNCERGFWFCSYGCSGWHWECWPDNLSKATLDGKNMAKTWAQLVGGG